MPGQGANICLLEQHYILRACIDAHPQPRHTESSLALKHTVRTHTFCQHTVAIGAKAVQHHLLPQRSPSASAQAGRLFPCCRRSSVLVAGGGAAAWLAAGGLVAAGAAAASGLFGGDNPQQLVRTGMDKFRQVSRGSSENMACWLCALRTIPS
eukprot:GHRQ01031389.1.p1 GENE.GHRQ01031389.1~~GHRQ01031389.1.p1  ORF type:complete len:153 (+),score=17.55 GHRQ01031389.1:306-764(+)